MDRALMRLVAWKALAIFCLPPLLLNAGEDEDSRRELYLYFAGRDIYQSQCLPCHGSRGRGDGPWSEGLTKDRPRNFRAGVFKFRTTPMGYLPTDEDLSRTIRHGITGTSMPSFQKLSGGKVEAVIAYVKRLSRAWEDPARIAEAHVVPEHPAWIRTEEHASAGKALFATYCASCHGENGQGNGPASQSLQDVWGHAIAPADLGAAHLKSGDRPEDLYRTIALGLDGTPMMGFRELLSDEQIWDLIAYIGTLRRAGSS